MEVFYTLEVDEALAHAAAGGQALHLHRIIPCRKRAPRCFVTAVDRGEPIAHLFDLDAERLKRTVRSLGVKVVYVDRAGTARQHIDLCGGPLKKCYSLLADDQKAKLVGVLAALRPAPIQPSPPLTESPP